MVYRVYTFRVKWGKFFVLLSIVHRKISIELTFVVSPKNRGWLAIHFFLNKKKFHCMQLSSAFPRIITKYFVHNSSLNRINELHILERVRFQIKIYFKSNKQNLYLILIFDVFHSYCLVIPEVLIKFYSFLKKQLKN